MKNSNEYIKDKVYNTNLKYVKLQNKTEELFFKCLDENQPVEYFEEQLNKIWGDIDRSFFIKDLEEYAEIIHLQNTNGEQITEDVLKGGIFELTAIAVILSMEKLFKKHKEYEYQKSLNSPAYERDKQEYLKRKVAKYSNNIVPYYSKTTGRKLRDVQLSTYAAMIHNTNLTKTAWNTTLNDAQELNENYFYIPYHSFSCIHCISHQNKLYTKEQILNVIGTEATEQEGSILHPNCKCILTIYKPEMIITKPRYSEEELIEQYNIRQKVNSLTLKRERLITDMKIQKRLGNQDEVDKITNKIVRINDSIKNLESDLPTSELRKQVVAINR